MVIGSAHAVMKLGPTQNLRQKNGGQLKNRDLTGVHNVTLTPTASQITPKKAFVRRPAVRLDEILMNFLTPFFKNL